MPSSPPLSATTWLLAALPIAFLTGAILWRRWPAPRAGAAAWLLALAVALLAFGADARLGAVATAKGLSLAGFVLAIIWSSVYLYNVADRVGAIESIGRGLGRVARDPLVQALLVAWGFAGFVQGITGFGVPVAVATPLLVMMGFPLVRAAALVLVGHGWAVTFGSLGSSYYTLELVTGLPADVLAPHTAALFAIPIVATGLVVTYLADGWGALRRGTPLVLAVGALTAATHWLFAASGAPQVASAVAGLVAMGGTVALARTPLLERDRQGSEPATPAAPPRMGFHLAFLPYYCLIALSLSLQFVRLTGLGDGPALALDFPSTATAEGFVVPAAPDYAAIRLLGHPGPLILTATLLTAVVYGRLGRWEPGLGIAALRATYTQSLPTSIGVATMVMMAAVMADSGMTTLLAQGLAGVSSPIFPLVAPYIGVLGAFMTGSNTNSNALFGLLQVETARELGIGRTTIAAAQTIGGSIGSSIAPAKVLVAATLADLAGREGEILRTALPYVLGLVLVAGVEALVLTRLLPAWAR